MGVEHYLVCRQCKHYIDLHKAYAFAQILWMERPPAGCDCKESKCNHVTLRGGYWESRGLWFLWNHLSHKDVELLTDLNDAWYDLLPYLEEKFPYEKDIAIREQEEKE